MSRIGRGTVSTLLRGGEALPFCLSFVGGVYHQTSSSFSHDEDKIFIAAGWEHVSLQIHIVAGMKTSLEHFARFEQTFIF